MFGFPIKYNEPLFRPPSEAYSLILQLTLGCSWNKCAFCEMYSSKKFSVRSEEDVNKDIDRAAEYSTDIRKIFLADGNAMVLSSSKLLKTLEYLNEKFPKLNRVSAYAIAKDLENKTIDELKALKDAGLKLLYVGIESGDDELLGLINKGETQESTIRNLLKAKEAGIKSSVMILNGLGGKIYSEQHARNSARVVNETQPDFLSALVLSFPYGTEHYKKKFKGDFKEINPIELLREMHLFISETHLESTIFRSDHASNYLSLKGILSRDKEKLLHKLNLELTIPTEAFYEKNGNEGCKDLPESERPGRVCDGSVHKKTHYGNLPLVRLLMLLQIPYVLQIYP